MEGVASYKNGTKETWRGWQWNQIVDMLCDGRPLGQSATRSVLGDKTVLYLVGPDDADRACAVKKGFDSQNLFAIDINRERVQAVRDCGHPAICGPLHQVLIEWPGHHPIDVVVADFCHGMTNDASGLINSIAASPGLRIGTVVSVNMMRGRDKDSHSIREYVSQALSEMPRDVQGVVKPHEKHRGALLHVRIMMYLVTMIEAMRGKPLTQWDLVVLDQKLRKIMQPRFYHYRSPASGQYFDSIIFRWPLQYYGTDVNFKALATSANKLLSPKSRNNEGIRQQIAAIRAVRTARLRRGEPLRRSA